MVIFPLAPDQTIAQMWSNGARGWHSFDPFHPANIYVITYRRTRTSPHQQPPTPAIDGSSQGGDWASSIEAVVCPVDLGVQDNFI